MTTNGSTTPSNSEYRLHTYYKSSCSGRLRIALNLKDIPVEYVYVHLFKGEQQSQEHLNLNPSGMVPVLTPLKNGKETGVSITQSVAALEYLEEVHPDRAPLLPPPSDPVARAHTRTLVSIICIDIQPHQNRRISKTIKDLGGDTTEWTRSVITRGLRAYEAIASKTAGKYSVGDTVTMADVCLVPQMWGAEKFGVDFEKLPTVTRVYNALSGLEAVQKAHWTTQADTPDDLAWL